MKYPTDLQTLICLLQKLPGVGKKSAERFAFSLLDWKVKDLVDASNLLGTLKARIQSCGICGCLMDEGRCPFCLETRDPSQMCIIASPKDAYAIEETHAYPGLYHVINVLLSPLDGRCADQLNLGHLTERLQQLGTKELIIALDSTLEGDATALYIKNNLKPLNLSITRLAFGMPVGSSLDYIDEGTLSLAMSGRRTF